MCGVAETIQGKFADALIKIVHYGNCEWEKEKTQLKISGKDVWIVQDTAGKKSGFAGLRIVRFILSEWVKIQAVLEWGV